MDRVQFKKCFSVQEIIWNQRIYSSFNFWQFIVNFYCLFRHGFWTIFKVCKTWRLKPKNKTRVPTLDIFFHSKLPLKIKDIYNLYPSLTSGNFQYIFIVFWATFLSIYKVCKLTRWKEDENPEISIEIYKKRISI